MTCPSVMRCLFDDSTTRPDPRFVSCRMCGPKFGGRKYAATIRTPLNIVCYNMTCSI